jgi:hypothetical protein
MRVMFMTVEHATGQERKFNISKNRVPLEGRILDKSRKQVWWAQICRQPKTDKDTRES